MKAEQSLLGKSIGLAMGNTDGSKKGDWWEQEGTGEQENYLSKPMSYEQILLTDYGLLPSMKGEE